MPRLLAPVLLVLALSFAVLSPARAQPGPCRMPATAAPPFQVLTPAPSSGAPLTIAWSDPWDAAADCPGARYLVLAMPREVRFSGSGFLAQEPGAPAPFRIGFAEDRMRVFIPLHDGDHGAGRLDILPYLTGGFTLDWALAYVPVFLTWAGEPVVATGAPLALELAAGRPRIIVQDPFDVEKPKETILSNDGRFLLEVRAETFRVLNAQTGALVYAGPGYQPNFSPGSRYVHAVGPAIELEEGYSHLRSDLVVVDLYAERPVLELDGGGGSRSGFVHALHWAWNDSLLFVGHVGAGAVTFKQMLHDDREAFANAHGCGACTFADGGVADLRGADGVMKLGHGPTGETFDVIDLVDPSRHRVFDFDAPEPPAVPGFGLQDAALVHKVDLSSPDARSWVLFNPDDTLPPEPVATHRVQDRIGADLAAAVRVDDGNGLTRGAMALSKSVGIGAQRRALVRLADFGIVLRQAPRLVRELTDEQFEALDLPEDDPAWDELDYYDADGEPIEENLRALAARPQNCRAAMPAMVARRLTLDEARTLCAREATALLDQAFDTCMDTEAYVWTLAAAGGVSIIHQRVCRMGSSSAAYGLVTFLRHDRDGQRAELLSGHPTLFLTEEPGEEESDAEPALKGILPLFAEAPLVVQALAPNRLAIAGRDRRILVVDPVTMDVVSTIRTPSSAEDIDLLGLLEGGTHLLQLDRDGRFYVHALADGAQTLSGLYVDDELVVMDPDLRYQATPEGARYVQVKFPGDPVLYSLQNLAAPLKTDRLVAARLGQRAALAAPPAIGRPPQVELVSRDEMRVRLRLAASGGLSGLSLFRDGMRIAQTPLSGERAELDIDLPALPETRWFSLQASDRKGLSSRTLTLPRPALAPGPATAPSGNPQGRLFVLAVGTDRFDDRRIAPLGFAVADAQAFAAAFADPGRYREVETEVLADDPDLAAALSARLEAIAARMRPEDTLFLHVAGHGLTDAAGRLHLAHRKTSLDDLETTALSFDTLAQRLAALPGRVMVFLDACHSGAAGTTSNDDAVDVLLRQDRPIAVLAASKGRQFSYESAVLRGGAFTGAVVAALARPATDLDGNGVVELDELYAQVKADVVAATQARQTPWIAQSGFVGPVPLY